MALKTSVLPFPACAFFPRGPTKDAPTHLAHACPQNGVHRHLAATYSDDDEVSEDVLVDRQNVPRKAKEGEDNRNVTSK